MKSNVDYAKGIFNKLGFPIFDIKEMVMVNKSIFEDEHSACIALVYNDENDKAFVIVNDKVMIETAPKFLENNGFQWETFNVVEGIQYLTFPMESSSSWEMLNHFIANKSIAIAPFKTPQSRNNNYWEIYLVTNKLNEQSVCLACSSHYQQVIEVPINLMLPSWVD